MEQAQPMIPDYKIVRKSNLSDMEKEIDALMKDGWQIVGDVKPYMEGSNQAFYRELVKLRPDQEAIDKARHDMEEAQRHFDASYNALDQRIKDLLDINNIKLLFTNGAYFTSVDGKVEDGISPYNILQKIKNSGHFPIDLEDDAFLKALGEVY